MEGQLGQQQHLPKGNDWHKEKNNIFGGGMK
jgi:hypothetical protein